MKYDEMPVDVVDFAYQIIDLHERNIQLERDLAYMTEARDQFCEMANARREHSNDLFATILKATLIPALDGNVLGYTKVKQ